MSTAEGQYPDSRFVVEIEGLERAGFSACHLPSARTAVVEYREGNDRGHTTRKLPGLTDYGPLVLKGGIAFGATRLFRWHRLAREGRLDEARRTVTVVVQDADNESGPGWEFRNAWPSRYEGPRLDATGEAVALETLEIVHEGFERTDE
jgi:phage tail-like protein